MKSLLRFSKTHGWLCDRAISCKFCSCLIQEGGVAWYLRDLEMFACQKCFDDKRKVGKLYGFGQAIPTKIVAELPNEMKDEAPEREW